MKYFILPLLMLISCHLNAQEDSIQINTDRPGFSEYPKAIPKGYFQVEAGFSFESESVGSNDKLQVISWNNTLVKYGLMKGWELRINQTYQSYRLFENGNSPEFNWLSISGPLVLGTKIDLLKESDYIPQTAIVAEYGFNTLKPETYQRNNFFRIQLTSKYQLNPEWYLMGNLGYVEFFSDFSRINFTINTGYSLNKKLSVYAEIYGYRSNFLTPLNYFDGGFTYLINPKFQLDLHAGFDLVQQSNLAMDYQQSFVAMGLGYLFKIQK